jgi:hypothetical protein
MQSSEQSVTASNPIVNAPAATVAVQQPGVTPEHGDEIEHIHLPPPTIWPFTVAGGVTLGFLGLVTNEFVSYLGIIIAIYGVVNWIQELRHELH